MERRAQESPPIILQPQQLAFEAQARKLGLRPSDPWVGAYVDYEWRHLRLVVEALPLTLARKHVLEFGCNVGASAILFSSLGAQVSAIDICPEWVKLARLNAARYGVANIAFAHVPDTRALPFVDEQFNVISCNSVLEYVDEGQRAAIQREIDRVLTPGGMILLTGTSNRLWPKEIHSGRWLVNYLPRCFDRLWSKPPQRGIWPWTARHGFGPHYVNLDTAEPHNFFARSRGRMGAPPRLLKFLLWSAARLRVGPGMLTHNLSCLLQKRGTRRGAARRDAAGAA
ncbi:SAM-dependent methyltransferase [Oxalobacteraceae bacterium GrIS 1.11]